MFIDTDRVVFSKELVQQANKNALIPMFISTKSWSKLDDQSCINVLRQLRYVDND